MRLIVQRRDQRLIVAESGTISMPSGASSVTFEYRDLTFVLQFARASGAPSINATQDGERKITLRLFDFDNPVGTAYDGEIGSIDGAPFHLSLAVYAIGVQPSVKHPPRVLHYSLLTGAAK